MLTSQAYRNLKLGSGGSYSLSRDALKRFVWDTWYFKTTGVENHTFFSTGIGSPWRNAGTKTLNETNLENGGRFPNGQTFLATHISVALQVYTASDDKNMISLIRSFYNIMYSSVFQIVIAGRPFDYEAHGTNFMARPVSAVGSIDPTADYPVRVGETTGSGILALDPAPIFIDQLVNFKVVHTVDNGDPDVVTNLNTDASTLAGEYGTYQVALCGFFTRAK